MVCRTLDGGISRSRLHAYSSRRKASTSRFPQTLQPASLKRRAPQRDRCQPCTNARGSTPPIILCLLDAMPELTCVVLISGLWFLSTRRLLPPRPPSSCPGETGFNLYTSLSSNLAKRLCTLDKAVSAL
eukprot:775987-Rhodomonas_salina.2